MTPRDDERGHENVAEDEAVQERAERRRRLAEVFGDVLPAQTSDDRDPPSGEGESGHEEWLRRQVPPHHG